MTGDSGPDMYAKQDASSWSYLSHHAQDPTRVCNTTARGRDGSYGETIRVGYKGTA